LASTVLVAQSAPQSTEPEPSTQSLLDRIEQLEKRISELEDHERKEAAAQTGTSNSQAATESKPAQVSAMPTQALHSEHAASTAFGRQKSITLPCKSGFRTWTFGDGPEGFGERLQSGAIRAALCFAVVRESELFGELSFTAQPNTYDLNVERTIIRYDYNDYFKLSFGKVSHTDQLLEHGFPSWGSVAVATISRPQMVKFGGTDIPLHFVGLQAEGNVPSGGLGLGYNVGMGNGRSSNFAKAGDSGDVNNNRAWFANLYARPARLYGLQVGGSFYRDKLTPQTGINFDEWIASANLVWDKQRPEFLAEYANVHHRDLQTSQTFNTTNYYVQLAYRLPWQQSKWKPYYRTVFIGQAWSRCGISRGRQAWSTWSVRSLG
jgi:hypothetical protein